MPPPGRVFGPRGYRWRLHSAHSEYNSRGFEHRSHPRQGSGSAPRSGHDAGRQPRPPGHCRQAHGMGPPRPAPMARRLRGRGGTWAPVGVEPAAGDPLRSTPTRRRSGWHRLPLHYHKCVAPLAATLRGLPEAQRRASSALRFHGVPCLQTPSIGSAAPATEHQSASAPALGYWACAADQALEFAAACWRRSPNTNQGKSPSFHLLHTPPNLGVTVFADQRPRLALHTSARCS
jgi:hypothetical protein